MTPPEQKLRDENEAHLGPRQGYQNKVWDEFVRLAPLHQDTRIMDAILDFRPSPGIASSQYRFDLLKILTRNPAFFVSSVDHHFAGNLDCAIHWLLPQSRLIGLFEVDQPVKKALQADPSNARLKKFLVRSQEQANSIEAKTDSPLKLANCGLNSPRSAGK